jgi:phosphoribosylformylglycinamidine synthase
MAMTAAVVVFPGSNCDHDAIHALRNVFGVKTHEVWHADSQLPPVDLVVLPGGFSYGDYLRSGAIARFASIMKDVARHASSGRPVLGICNGFQILCEAGLLPGVLMPNATLSFVCRRVHLVAENRDSPFTRGIAPGRVLAIPIAHHDGRYTADEETLDRLEGEGLVAFRYATPDGRVTDEANPNGAMRNVAGVLNAGRNVLGLMPHPERAVEALVGGEDGRAIFESLLSGEGRAA